MKIRCNFGDAEKIREMLNEKYTFADFKVREIRNPVSSLNNIEIYDRDNLSISLEATFGTYMIKDIARYSSLEFIGDICECLAETQKNS